jgi:hypothetical protein
MENSTKVIYGLLVLYVFLGASGYAFKKYSVPRGENYDFTALIGSAVLTIAIPFAILNDISDDIAFRYHLLAFILMYLSGLIMFTKMLKLRNKSEKYPSNKAL